MIHESHLLVRPDESIFQLYTDNWVSIVGEEPNKYGHGPSTILFIWQGAWCNSELVQTVISSLAIRRGTSDVNTKCLIAAGAWDWPNLDGFKMMFCIALNSENQIWC